MSRSHEVTQNLLENDAPHDEFGVSRLLELQKTEEGREEFQRRIEEGMKTLSVVVRRERLVLQRPEWLVSGHQSKIY